MISPTWLVVLITILAILVILTLVGHPVLIR